MASATPDRARDWNSVDQPFDYMFKLLTIGNSGVGKTCFLLRYCNDSFSSAFVSTVGIDFRLKTLVRNERKIKLQIWDTAGQERFHAILKSMPTVETNVVLNVSSVNRWIRDVLPTSESPRSSSLKEWSYRWYAVFWRTVSPLYSCRVILVCGCGFHLVWWWDVGFCMRY